MRGTKLKIVTLAVALLCFQLFPGAARAEDFSITAPQDTDLFLTSDNTITLTANKNAECAINPPSGTASDTTLTATGDGAYQTIFTIDGKEGEWRISCNAMDTAESDAVKFLVKDDAHPAIFLRGESSDDFKNRFSEFFIDPSAMTTLTSNWQSFCKSYQHGDAPDPSLAVDPAVSGWVHACALYYYLHHNATFTAYGEFPSAQPKNYGVSLFARALLYMITGATDYLETLTQMLQYLLDGPRWRYLVYNVFNGENGTLYTHYTYQASSDCTDGYTSVYQNSAGDYFIEASATAVAVSVNPACLVPADGTLNDLDRGEILQDMSLIYDLLFPHLSVELRRELREKILIEVSDYAEDYFLDIGCLKDNSLSGASLEECNFESYWLISKMFLPDGRPTNCMRRTLHNGHPWMGNAAVAIPYYALYHELTATRSAERDAWLTMTDGNLRMFLDYYRPTNGTRYWAYDITSLIYHNEARLARTGEDLFKSYASQINTGALYNFWMRYPNGELNNSEDSDYSSWGNFGANNAYLAKASGDRLLQLLAWNNYPPFPTDWSARSFSDLLFYDRNILPKTTLSDVPRHRLFGDKGEVSLRTSWETDATMFIFKSGPFTGGHQHPSAGSIQMFGGGAHLVTEQGKNSRNPYKRTGAYSTLFVDGAGSHGEFVWFSGAAPEGTGAKITAYTEIRNPEGTLDLVGMRGDLTKAYKWDEDKHKTALGMTSVRDEHKFFFSDKSALNELIRIAVWKDGNVILLDRYRASEPYRFDWKLQARKFIEDNGIAIPVDEYDDSALGYDGACQVPQSADGFHQWLDENGVAIGLNLSEETAWSSYLGVSFADGSACLRYDSGERCDWAYAYLNENKFVPTFSADDKNCENPIHHTDFESEAFIYHDDPESGAFRFDGALKVVALDDSAATMQVYPTFHDNGEIIAGFHLNRYADGGDGPVSGQFVTALLPTSVSNPGMEPDAKVEKMSDVVGGTGVRMTDALHDTTVLFWNKDGTRVHTTTARMTVYGDAGVAVFAKPAVQQTAPLALQMIHGTRLDLRSKIWLESDRAISLSLTFERCLIAGTIDLPSPGDFFNLAIYTGDKILDRATLDGKPVPVITEPGRALISLPHGGRLVLKSGRPDC